MASHLYTKDILRLATSLAGHGRLEHAEARADRRSPTCGSRVIADVVLDEQGRIGALGLEARACALGQASAALVGEHATGRSAEEMRVAAEVLRAWLASTQDGQAADFWPGIGVFAAARAYPARHPSILLAFEAVRDAVEQALALRNGAAA